MGEIARQITRARALAKEANQMPRVLDVDLDTFAALQLEVMTRMRGNGADLADAISRRAPRQVNVLVDEIWVTFVGLPPVS